MLKKLLFIALLFLFSNGYSQTHVYKFNGGLTEFGGIGPTLTQLFDVSCAAPPSGTAGGFPSQLITTSSCTRGPQPVFAFNANSGLSYPNTVFISGTYTINILYKLNSYSAGAFGFQRLIDFKNAASDDGLYTRDNGGSPTLVYAIGGFPTNIPTVPALVAGQFYLITLVRNGATNAFTVYLNGTAVLTNYPDGAGLFASAGNPIIFFRDDLSTGCESTDGSARYISIANSTSSALAVQTTWITLCNGLLKPNLVNFNAQKNNSDALLQWQTGNENTSYFDIERSYNGQSYTAIDRVNAEHAAVNNYTYNDHNVFSSSNVNVFYRLKIMDINGSYEYSPVVKLTNSKNIKISVFPNPATDVISLSGLRNTDVIKLVSVEGKVLIQQNARAESVIMHIEKYPSGTYIIQVQNDMEVIQQKFVKR